MTKTVTMPRELSESQYNSIVHNKTIVAQPGIDQASVNQVHSVGALNLNRNRHSRVMEAKDTA